MMHPRFCLLPSVFGLLLLSACAPPTPGQRFVADVAAALGGRDRIAALRTVSIEAEGTNYNLGQDLRPGAATQTFTVSGYARRIDLAANRARVEQTRTPNFAYFQGPASQRQIFGVDGDSVYTVNASGAASSVGGQAATDRRIEVFGHPLVIMRAALASEAAIANVRTAGAERLADITTGTGLTFTLVANAAGLPVRAEVAGDHPNLGDVTVTIAFADYQDVKGIKLPTRLTTKVDDFTTAELRVSTQSVDGEVGELAAPSGLPASPAPAAPTVTVEPIAKGLWVLAGQSHHSVLVEWSDHLMLIEAPQSEARTQAVIAKARETVPGKPLTHMVMTHHHFDHSAGLRAAIAEGMTVIAHSGNRDFVEAMASRPHTRRPDALAKTPRPAAVQAVDDALPINDGTMAVTLFHVAGNPHSDTMLMAYFPVSRVLVEVDAFNPGAAVNPYAANLLANIEKRKLRIDRIVPLHGAIAPFTALTKAGAAK